VKLCERIISVNLVIMPKIPQSGVSSRTRAGMSTREYANASHGPEVTVLNPGDLFGKVKTCFSQKRYGRVIE
jgi:hypothetical protein